jgi:hypothetical protein
VTQPFFYFIQSLIDFVRSFRICLFDEDRPTNKLHRAVELVWAQTIVRSKDVLQGFVRDASHWRRATVIGGPSFGWSAEWQEETATP